MGRVRLASVSKKGAERLLGIVPSAGELVGREDLDADLCDTTHHRHARAKSTSVRFSTQKRASRSSSVTGHAPCPSSVIPAKAGSILPPPRTWQSGSRLSPGDVEGRDDVGGASRGTLAIPAAPARSRYCSSASGLASASRFFTGAAVHDVAHRELDDLAALGARDVGDLHDLRRHVARRGVARGSCCLIRSTSASSSATPVAQRTNSTTRVVARPAASPGRSRALSTHLGAAARPGGRSRRCRCARRPG